MNAPMFTVSKSCEGCAFTLGDQCFLDKQTPKEGKPCSWHSAGTYVSPIAQPSERLGLNPQK